MIGRQLLFTETCGISQHPPKERYWDISLIDCLWDPKSFSSCMSTYLCHLNTFKGHSEQAGQRFVTSAGIQLPRDLKTKWQHRNTIAYKNESRNRPQMHSVLCSLPANNILVCIHPDSTDKVKRSPGYNCSSQSLDQTTISGVLNAAIFATIAIHTQSMCCLALSL